MKNYFKLYALSLAIITGLSRESFAMDQLEIQIEPIICPQLKNRLDEIEKLPTNKIVFFKVNQDEYPLHKAVVDLKQLFLLGECYLPNRAPTNPKDAMNYADHLSLQDFARDMAYGRIPFVRVRTNTNELKALGAQQHPSLAFVQPKTFNGETFSENWR